MKERPIIFNADMVRAILDGRKTQTRREVKPQGAILTDDMARSFGVRPPLNQNSPVIRCPYGQPGDRLWVRETHAIVPRTAYRCSEGVQQTLRPADDHDAAIYRAGWVLSTGGIRWLPSIHMPRWASRITLEIKSVNVERLHDISEDDAMAEGLRKLPHKGDFAYAWRENDNHGHGSARGAFISLWQSIYGQESWDSNPWIWVIKFERKNV